MLFLFLRQFALNWRIPALTLVWFALVFSHQHYEVRRGEQSEAVKAVVDKLMDRSKVQAPQVAEAALKSVLAGKLYVLPMADARFLWRFKRLLPSYFQSRMIVPKRK